MEGIRQLRGTGEVVTDHDLREPNKMWQHPWHLAHRVGLHNKLKDAATSKQAPGPPATLHTASRVSSVDCDAGRIVLEDGLAVPADVIIGADGVNVSRVHPPQVGPVLL